MTNLTFKLTSVTSAEGVAEGALKISNFRQDVRVTGHADVFSLSRSEGIIGRNDDPPRSEAKKGRRLFGNVREDRFTSEEKMQ